MSHIFYSAIFNPETVLGFNEGFKIASSVALGIQYLHSIQIWSY